MHNAKLFLFETHLCFETVLFGFTNRRTVALRDVLALHKPESANGTSLGGAAGSGSGVGVGFGGGKRREQQCVVQCRSLSLSLSIPSAVFDHIVSEIEAARVAALDMSTLLGDTASPTEVIDVDVAALRLSVSDGDGFAATPAVAPVLRPANAASNDHKRRGGTLIQVDSDIVQQMHRMQGHADGHAHGGGARGGASSGHGGHRGGHGGHGGGGGGGGGAIGRLGTLTEEQWGFFLRGAEQLRFGHGDFVIREGDTQRALYQVVKGTLRVELQIKGRPQAVVVGRRKIGDLFGERSLLSGGAASASVVVDSDDAVVLRVTSRFLESLFDAHPELMGKFFCLMAVDQAKRLTRLTRDADNTHQELQLPEGLSAPTDMPSLLSNAAYLTIVGRYIQSRGAQHDAAAAGESGGGSGGGGGGGSDAPDAEQRGSRRVGAAAARLRRRRSWRRKSARGRRP